MPEDPETERTALETGSWAALTGPLDIANTYVLRTPSECAAMQIRRHREAKRWKQQELVDRLNKLGLHMDRTTVAKIETGKRKVTVDELLAIAVALDVAPPHLLSPLDDQQVFVAPAVPLTGRMAWAWTTARSPVGGIQDEVAFFEPVQDGDLPPRYRGLLHLQKLVGFALSYARKGNEAKTEQALDALEIEMKRRQEIKALAELEEEEQ